MGGFTDAAAVVVLKVQFLEIREIYVHFAAVFQNLAVVQLVFREVRRIDGAHFHENLPDFRFLED